MDFNEYQDLASRSANKDLDNIRALCNWAMGLCGEAGEYSEIIKKFVFHGKPLTTDKAKDELSDVLWYLSQCARELDIKMEDIAVHNINKLKARYPNSFVQGGGIRNE